MKLTQSAIKKMSYGKTPVTKGGKTFYPQDIRWDDSLSGFGIRLYPTGKKSFVLFYRASGRQHIMTVGRYGVLTLDQARDKARKHLTQVLDGNDPLVERQKELRGETIKDLCDEYLKRHAKAHKKSWKDDEQRINKYIQPAWKNIKINALKRSDVAQLHSKIGKKHPYAANRTLKLVAVMFKFAKIWGYLDNTAPNPAHGIKAFEEKKRDRWVTPEELPKLAQAIDQEENVYARYALWLYLLTGLRRNELLTAKWDDIDWEREELRVEETKAKRVHYIPLSGAALALLREIPKLEDNPYVFPGEKKKKHLVNIDKPWNRVRNRATILLWADSGEKLSKLITRLTKELERPPTCAEVRKSCDFDLPQGMEDVRLHDLRRTVGSWLAQSGNSLHLIGRILNHSNQKTTAVYARFGQDNVRQALEDHGQQIMGIAGKRTKAKVVNLKK